MLFLCILSGTCIKDLPEGTPEVEAITWIEQALN